MKLELDSFMTEEELLSELEVFGPNGAVCTGMNWNCIEVTTPMVTLLQQIVDQCHSNLQDYCSMNSNSQPIWEHVELEECTGPALEELIRLAFASPTRTITFSSTPGCQLSRESLQAMASGMTNNTFLQELNLSLPLDVESVTILSQGWLGTSALRKLSFRGCQLQNDLETVVRIADSLSKASSSLEELGWIGLAQCGSEDILDTLLQGCHDCRQSRQQRNVWKQLDLRGLASGTAPITRLLQNNSTIQVLDLSYPNVNNNEQGGLQVSLLAEGIRSHPTLHTLHLCKCFLTTTDLDILLEAIQTTRTTFQLLNVSLNLISNVKHLGTFLEHNRLPLRRLWLDGNPLEDVLPLIQAMETNSELEECIIPQELEECQQRLHTYTRLNRGGRRLVLGHDPVSTALWSVVLERAMGLTFDTCPNALGQVQVVYCLLQGQMLFPT